MKPQEMKVLIIGDGETRPVLQDLLRCEGYVNVKALPGLEVLKGAADAAYDLLIVDSSASGEQRVATELERLSQEVYFPILVLTDADSEIKNRLLSGGAKDVVAKPFDPKELGLRVHHLLQARALHLEVERQKRYLEVLLTLQRQIVTSPLEEIYAHILEAAVRTVPGAEAGSLLVREGGVMCFKAVHGYNLNALNGVGFSDADMARWHGGDAVAWRRGEPRVLSRKDAAIEARASATTKPQMLAQTGRLEEIQANLYVPVVYQDEVLAVLNLDNMSSQEAFAKEALAAARLFGFPVAALLHEAHLRHLLEKAALTDPLTGLLNRRGFDGALARELAGAARHGEPFAVLIMDLTGFKRVNDELGHDRGDLALSLVARTLEFQAREEDRLARWGGDEFAALLPHTNARGAAETAWRYARATEAVDPGGVHLGVSIGLAMFPGDGDDAASLFRVADSRMYAAKQRGLTFLENV